MRTQLKCSMFTRPLSTADV